MATTPTITDGRRARRQARARQHLREAQRASRSDRSGRAPAARRLRRRRGVPQHRRGHRSPRRSIRARRRSPRWRRGAPAARLPRRPGSGRCEPHRRHRVAPAEPRRGRGTGATGPSPAATTARFPRDEPAILSAARRQAPQAAHTAPGASSRALDRRDPPRAAAAAASPGAERAAAGSRRARVRTSRCPPDRSRPAWRPTRRPSSCERRL